MKVLRVERIAEGDDLGCVRAFARLRLLDYVRLYASLDCPPLRERSQLLAVIDGESVVGLAAVVEGVFRHRCVSVCGRLPGAVRLLLGEIGPPFVVLAPQPLWHELERLGGVREAEEVQMARLHPTDLPDPDPRVQRLERAEEVRHFLEVDFSPVHFETGPFLGIRDPNGTLTACGGVDLVTDRVAQIASIQTRPDRRRKGLATAVLAGLIRELEARGRHLVLQVRPDDEAALRLFARFGFRGRVRTAQFSVTELVSPPSR